MAAIVTPGKIGPKRPIPLTPHFSWIDSNEERRENHKRQTQAKRDWHYSAIFIRYKSREQENSDCKIDAATHN